MVSLRFSSLETPDCAMAGSNSHLWAAWAHPPAGIFPDLSVGPAVSRIATESLPACASIPTGPTAVRISCPPPFNQKQVNTKGKHERGGRGGGHDEAKCARCVLEREIVRARVVRGARYRTTSNWRAHSLQALAGGQRVFPAVRGSGTKGGINVD